MSISPLTNTQPVQTAASAAQTQLVKDSDTFIKLLVTQVQNQDPLNPTDPTEFMGQLAQLTQVEQAVKTNENLEQLSTSLAMNAALNQTALVGREVTTISETFVLGPVGGQFSYEFGQSPSAVSAIIKDASGNVVRQIDGLSTESGKVIDVTWDGTDAQGNFAPEGEYSVTLATPDGSGGYNTYATSVVEAIEFSNGVPVMKLSDGRYASSKDMVRAS